MTPWPIWGWHLLYCTAQWGQQWGLGSPQEIWGGIGVTLRNMGWRGLGSPQRGEGWDGGFWGHLGFWGHPKGEQNRVESFGVTPRRNMGWNWGHPKKYGVEILGSPQEGWDGGFWGHLGSWGHLTGCHNGMERFGVTPRRNMG